MKKTTKASIATATGIALLLGGGGSLAYWNASANTGTATTIQAGTLTVTAVNSGQWTKSFNGGTASNVTIGTVQMVPGDKLVYTQTFNVVANGQSLYFTITPTDPTLGASTLNSRLTKTMSAPTLTSADSSVALTGVTAGVYKVVPANGQGTAVVTVTWTIEWPFGTSADITADNAAKSGTVSLTQGAVTLTQVAAQ